jgi:hypothetical protein
VVESDLTRLLKIYNKPIHRVVYNLISPSPPKYYDKKRLALQNQEAADEARQKGGLYVTEISKSNAYLSKNPFSKKGWLNIPSRRSCHVLIQTWFGEGFGPPQMSKESTLSDAIKTIQVICNFFYKYNCDYLV